DVVGRVLAEGERLPGEPVNRLAVAAADVKLRGTLVKGHASGLLLGVCPVDLGGLFESGSRSYSKDGSPLAELKVGAIGKWRLVPPLAGDPSPLAGEIARKDLLSFAHQRNLLP